VLSDVPVVLMLVGMAAYAVLAGADFGAGFWTLVPSGGRCDAETTRRHARHALGPVWEANHVWLIFVLVVCWTCYPEAFASITSTLAAPLLLAAIGIIFRGATYALRGQLDDSSSSGRRVVETVFALSCILTPFALGTVVGAIARPGRQRGRRPCHQLAQPDFDHDRRPRRCHRRVPGGGLPRSGRSSAR
jgi:cytochrome d ubiquinol oxidase subunit II